MVKKKKIYISGSTGFIGTQLQREFNPEEFELIKLKRDQLNSMSSFNFEENSHCIHLAAHVHNMDVVDKEHDKKMHEQVNYLLSVNLFKKFVNESKNGKFLFASTVHVHGNLTENNKHTNI